MKQKFQKLDKKMKIQDLKDENFNFPGRDDIAAYFIIQNVDFVEQKFKNAIYLGIHDKGFIQRKQ